MLLSIQGSLQMRNIQDIKKEIESSSNYSSFKELIIEEQEVLRVELNDYKELYVYLTLSGEELICSACILSQEEIVEGKIAELHELLLELNMDMPLSAFSKNKDRYVIYGSLISDSKIEHIIEEIEILCFNAVEVIEFLYQKEFLKNDED